MTTTSNNSNYAKSALQELAELEDRIAQLTGELEQRPNSVELYMKRGGCYYVRGDRRYRWLITQDSGRVSDAVEAQKQGCKLAVADWNKVLMLDNTHASAYYSCAIANEQLGRIEDALVDVENAIKHRFESLTDAYSLQGRLLLQLGRQQAALQVLNRVITQSNTLSTREIFVAYCQRGKIYAQLKDFQKALFDYQYLLVKLSKEKPAEFFQEYISLFFNLSDIFKLLMAEEKASTGLSFIRDCLALIPDEQLNGMGFFHALEPFFEHIFEDFTSDDCQTLSYGYVPNKHELLVSVVKEIQKRQPETIDRVIALAYAKFRQNIQNEKIRAGDYRISLAATSLLVHLNLFLGLKSRAFVYRMKRDFRLALKDWQAYIAAKPEELDDLCEAYEKAADCYEELGDNQMALTYYITAIEVGGDKATGEKLAELYNKRASLERTMHLYQQAVDDYTMAMRFDPGHISYAYWLAQRGLCYEKLGNLPQAEHDLRTALKFEPDNKYYHKWLEDVRKK